MRFDGKVAIVTGAGQGIGEAYAKGLAAAGAQVVVAEINEANGRRVVAEIESAGGRAMFVATDVADEASTQRMATRAVERYGGIDFLVNNAAIYHGMRVEGLLDVDLAYYNRFMAVNMNGCLLAARAVVPSMIDRGGGAIVNQSSTAAWMGIGYYGIAKLAVHGITASLARELGPRNIRVNAIAPGPTDTEATRSVVDPAVLQSLLLAMPIGRLGTPEDLIGPLLFLLSDEARWITGHVLNVDGGQVMRA